MKPPRDCTAREVTRAIRVLSEIARERLILSERPARYYSLNPDGTQTLIGRHMSDAYNYVRAEAAEQIDNKEERMRFWHVSWRIRGSAQYGVTGLARVF